MLAGVALVVGCIALAGCAAVSAGPGTESASPSPTATASAASLAGSFAFRIGCADLLTEEEVQAHIVVPVAPVVVESTPEIVDLPLAQARGLTCIWGGADRTDGGYDQGVQLRILPDAAADFAAWKPHELSGQCDPAVEGYCDEQFLAGESWVDLRMSDLVAADLADPHGAATQIEQLIGRRLAASQPAAAWSPSSTGISPVTDCGSRIDDVARIVGVPAAEVRVSPTYQDAGVAPSQSAVARERAKVGLCSWSTSDGSSTLSWEVLPGGAWAFSGFDRSQSVGLVGPLRSVSVAGARQAWIGCADSCVAVLEVGGSLVTMYTDYGMNDAALVSRAAASIAAFAS